MLSAGKTSHLPIFGAAASACIPEKQKAEKTKRLRIATCSGIFPALTSDFNDHIPAPQIRFTGKTSRTIRHEITMPHDYILAGATGLVGAEILKQLGSKTGTGRIFCLGRRAPENVP